MPPLPGGGENSQDMELNEEQTLCINLPDLALGIGRHQSCSRAGTLNFLFSRHPSGDDIKIVFGFIRL
jgi:hypothetical protein